MTSAQIGGHELYPQYCFNLSPTITKWCPLRAIDIGELKQHPGFGGQGDVFFHLNHPIRWVRIVGVVVAIDSYYARRVYTVDDSTGLCIECVVSIDVPKDSKAAVAESNPPADSYPNIDVGMVVDVKGSLNLFREQKQIMVGKLQAVESTSAEVRLWEKISEFRTHVLDHPWKLASEVLIELRAAQEKDCDKKERRQREKQKAETVQTGLPRRSRPNDSSSSRGPARDAADTKVTKSKPYRSLKLSTVATNSDDPYNVLGR